MALDLKINLSNEKEERLEQEFNINGNIKGKIYVSFDELILITRLTKKMQLSENDEKKSNYMLKCIDLVEEYITFEDENDYNLTIMQKITIFNEVSKSVSESKKMGKH